MFLSPTLYPADPASFARIHFGRAPLGDKRRSRRLVAFAGGVARYPGKSIPKICGGRSAGFNAVYDLLKRSEASPQAIREAHRRLVREAAEKASADGCVVLFIDDGSDFSWSGKAPIRGLGFVGNGADKSTQGFHVHSALAVRVPAGASQAQPRAGFGRGVACEVVGLAAQLFHVRAPESKRGLKAPKKRGGAEGRLWKEAGEEIGAAPEGARWLRVCDRGADIFEFLESCRALGHGFVVRAAQNRLLAGLEPGDGGKRYLLGELRAAAPFDGKIEVELRSRPGRKGRTATLRASSIDALIQAPARFGGKKRPLAIRAVRLFEVDAPEGVEPLEWLLLVDGVEGEGFAQAQLAARCYAKRWLIEEFHKALKTGLGAEELQLEDGARLMAAVATLSIVALRLLDLRERARLEPDAPAERAGLGATRLKILGLKTKLPLATLREVVRAIARMGGFPGRKGDGEPGWESMLAGWRELEALTEGYLLALDSRCQE